MSFGSAVKSEICNHRLDKRCCRRAEVYGMALGLRAKKDGRFSFKSANIDVVEHAKHIFEKHLCQCEITKGKNGIYSLDSLSPFDFNELYTDPDKECCVNAFIRGAFLACGQLTNPGQTYRLDFNLANEADARRLHDLLVSAGFSPMLSVKSSKKATVYFKNSGNVEDLMTYMGAPLSTLGLMEIRVEKDYKNHLNRTLNFETANYIRSFSVGEQQIKAIRSLQQTGAFDLLPDNVKQIALIRLDNPDASLSELAQLAGISKSAVNRRLKSIMEYNE